MYIEGLGDLSLEVYLNLKECWRHRLKSTILYGISESICVRSVHDYPSFGFQSISVTLEYSKTLVLPLLDM